MAFALRANCGPRWLSGFLTMFMAFLLRENPIDDWRPEVLLGLVIGAAGLGNTLGIAVASLLQAAQPALTVVLALLADASWCSWRRCSTAWCPLVLLGLTAGLAQSLAKLSLDSTIQRDVHERMQSSAFARSDTTLQLAWVIGGFVRHRDAADAAPGAGRRVRRAGRVGGVRAGDRPAPRPAPGGPSRPSRAPAQSSSSSASARSSLAVGFAVRLSGWRPCR